MFVTTVLLSDLSSAADLYLALPNTCRLVKAMTALITTLTTGDSTITLSDGTTDIGTITITQDGCAVGDIDNITFDTTSLGKVALGGTTYLKISNNATPGQGAALLTLVLDEFHSEI